MAEEPKNKRTRESYMGAGIAIGVGLGVALGAAIDNIGLGIALGAGLGVVFGAIQEAQAHKENGEDDSGEE